MYWKVTYQAWNGVTKTQLVHAANKERATAVFSKLSGVTGRAILSVEQEDRK